MEKKVLPSLAVVDHESTGILNGGTKVWRKKVSPSFFWITKPKEMGKKDDCQ